MHRELRSVWRGPLGEMKLQEWRGSLPSRLLQRSPDLRVGLIDLLAGFVISVCY